MRLCLGGRVNADWIGTKSSFVFCFLGCAQPGRNNPPACPFCHLASRVLVAGVPPPCPTPFGHTCVATPFAPPQPLPLALGAYRCPFSCPCWCTCWLLLERIQIFCFNRLAVW